MMYEEFRPYPDGPLLLKRDGSAAVRVTHTTKGDGWTTSTCSGQMPYKANTGVWVRRPECVDLDLTPDLEWMYEQGPRSFRSYMDSLEEPTDG